jgi:hypothetical protein
MKNPRPDIDAHTEGTRRAEEWTRKLKKKEPGREGPGRTSRDATGINAEKRGPIDPRMPNLPPS